MFFMTDLENQEGLEDQDFENEWGNDSDENQNVTKKNKSNWKEVTASLKWANLKIAALEAQLQKQNNNTDDLRLFFLENPELSIYKDTIAELKSNNQYNWLSMDDLLVLAKNKQPAPSTDKEEFSIKNSVASWKKDLADLTDEEALQLDNRQYLEWSRIQKQNSSDIWG